MNSIRKVLAGTLLAGGVLMAAATSFSIANAEDTAATAGTPSGAHGWHHHHGGPWHMYSKLGLTDDQKTSMKAIMTASKPQMETLHRQMRANQMKLMQATPGSANYESVVAEVAQANAALASQRTTQGAALRAKLEGILTDPQRTQLVTLRAEWASRLATPTTAQ